MTDAERGVGQQIAGCSDLPPLMAVVWGTLGIALAAASAPAINQVLDARIDAEVRLSGLRFAVGAVVIAVVVVAMLIGCLSATNEASRAVARWEVAEPVTR